MNIRKSVGLICACVVALSASNASAQCDPPGVVVNVDTTGTFTKTCTPNAVTGHWDLQVTINGNVISNSNVTITGTAGTFLGRVTIVNNTAIDARLHILGSGADHNIGGVGF